MINAATCAAVYFWLGIGLFWIIIVHEGPENERATGWMKWMEDNIDEMLLGFLAMLILIGAFLLWPLMIFMPSLWRRRSNKKGA